ncbi:MAG: ATP-binding protein [Spirochaetaceae bacterium]|jgi:anti-sigma regulatory factor (Ser/Thr protein kinase)|nr:ATP-binding protein [Spirochaetaceae bacterium]
MEFLHELLERCAKNDGGGRMNSDSALSLEAKAERLGDVVRFVDKELAAVACPGEIVNQIELAIEEIFLNISNYAYSGEAGTVTLLLHAITNEKQPTINITISDQGKPFNPLEHEDPDTTIPLEQRNIGGLGILLVKKMMTSVSYKYENGRNHLVLSKSW